MILGKANKECSWKPLQKIVKKKKEDLGFHEREAKKTKQPNNSQIILLSSSNPCKKDLSPSPKLYRLLNLKQKE